MIDRYEWLFIALIVVLFIIYCYRKNSQYRDALDVVAEQAGWQSRRTSLFTASVKGIWKGDRVALVVDLGGDYSDPSLSAQINRKTGTRKMVISERVAPSAWNTEIFPVPEVRLSNPGLSAELMVRSDDKRLAEWLFADQELAERVRDFVPKGYVSIESGRLQEVRSLPNLDEYLGRAASSSWDLAARMRDRMIARPQN